MKRVRPAEEVDTEELLRQWSEKANIEYRQAKVLYAILVDTLVDGLCVQFRSVDLGFAVIHPRPYRANWHNYILQRYPFMGQWLRARSRAERDRIVRESGVLSDMQDTYMLAVRNGLVYLGLEIAPKKSWWKYSLHIQRKLLAAAGPVGYCRAIGRLVNRLKERLFETHLSHLHEIGLPCGKLHSGRYWNGAQYLAENRKPKRVTPSAIPVRLSPAYVPLQPTELISSGAASDLEAAIESVHEVPAVEPGTKNLRDRDGKE